MIKVNNVVYMSYGDSIIIEGKSYILKALYTLKGWETIEPDAQDYMELYDNENYYYTFNFKNQELKLSSCQIR
jgi:hypothetical protein